MKGIGLLFLQLEPSPLPDTEENATLFLPHSFLGVFCGSDVFLDIPPLLRSPAQCFPRRAVYSVPSEPCQGGSSLWVFYLAWFFFVCRCCP